MKIQNLLQESYNQQIDEGVLDYIKTKYQSALTMLKNPPKNFDKAKVKESYNTLKQMNNPRISSLVDRFKRWYINDPTSRPLVALVFITASGIAIAATNYSKVEDIVVNLLMNSSEYYVNERETHDIVRKQIDPDKRFPEQ
jgi:hypothetical protein